MGRIIATRYHDISCGHRVVGHEGRCVHLHGHNYRIWFHCQAGCLDTVGRVVDFGVIKDMLAEWLEQNWDHRFLVWELDPLYPALQKLDSSVVAVPFNPTAENIATYLVEVVGPKQLSSHNVWLSKVTVEETAKCHATYESE